MSQEPYIVVGPTTARRIRAGRRVWPYLVSIGGIVLLGALIALLLWPRKGWMLVPVKRGDIVHSFVAQGRVETDATIDIVPKVPARIEAVHVKEGDAIEPGQLLVTLEDGPLRAARDEAARALDAAVARRDEIQRGTRQEDLDRAAAQVSEAEYERALAEAKRAELERGARPEEKKEAEALLLKAKADADFWTGEWGRIRVLAENGTASPRERDETKRNYESAQAALLQAQAGRDRVVNGATEEEKAQARAQVESAKARVDQAKASQARLKKGATDEERRVAEAEVKRAEATVTRVDSELAQLKLVSPIRGVVVRRNKEPAEMAYPQMPKPILIVAETQGRIVRIEVSESDIYKVREGQVAWITADAYPGRRWAGKVTRKADVMGRKTLVTEDPKEKADVKILEVRITPDAPLDLPLNLPVEAKIVETIRQNVLVLSARAVDGSGNVRLADGKIASPQTGARDDAFVEILSGLSEGDKVRLPQ